MTNKYILDGNRNVVVEEDLMTWGRWLENFEYRNVDRTERNGVTISTVFLALDHQFGEGEPILWETMVFNGYYDQDMDRCSGTWTDAEKMHARMVEKVFGKAWHERVRCWLVNNLWTVKNKFRLNPWG